MLALYDRALPEVYGYLLDRCGNAALAEDLTSETFLAAVRAVKGEAAPPPDPISVAWMVGVARHKLADHWRRRMRDDRAAAAIGTLDPPAEFDDPWVAHLDRAEAADLLGRLGEHHRAALTLRYVDGLPVAEVADLLGRTVHATEALLVRARAAFRRTYEKGASDAV